jgi:hypothetical protein
LAAFKKGKGVWESRGDSAMTNLASDVAALPSMVARLNIELFCKKLAEETNDAKRQTLLQLVDEEKAKLFALSPPSHSVVC